MVVAEGYESVGLLDDGELLNGTVRELLELSKELRGLVDRFRRGQLVSGG